jgi:hypothetical protein
VVSRSATYRENADECRRQAERSRTPADKERWLKIAEHWLQMAQEADEDRGWRTERLQVSKETSMSQLKEIAGRDRYIIVEDLAFAVEALSKLPIEFRPDNNIEDMKRLKQDANLGQLHRIAQRRLAVLLGDQGRP